MQTKLLEMVGDDEDTIKERDALQESIDIKDGEIKKLHDRLDAAKCTILAHTEQHDAWVAVTVQRTVVQGCEDELEAKFGSYKSFEPHLIPSLCLTP